MGRAEWPILTHQYRKIGTQTLRYGRSQGRECSSVVDLSSSFPFIVYNASSGDYAEAAKRAMHDPGFALKMVSGEWIKSLVTDGTIGEYLSPASYSPLPSAGPESSRPPSRANVRSERQAKPGTCSAPPIIDPPRLARYIPTVH